MTDKTKPAKRGAGKAGGLTPEERAALKELTPEDEATIVALLKKALR